MDSGQSVRDLGTLSLNGIFIKPLPSQIRSYVEEEAEDCESQRGWVTPGKQCLQDNTMT